ncbi:MAG: FapA family protein [Desulfobacterales bacterium]|nr:FapA family protein [Desulfobacterales bacterium]
MTDTKTAKTACPHCGTVYKLPERFISKAVLCKRCGQNFKAVSGESPKTYPIIGKLALKYGLIQQEQLEAALAYQAAHASDENKIRLETVFLEKGYLSEQQLSLLHFAEKYWHASQLARGYCAVAVARKLITRKDADEALKAQSTAFSNMRTIRKISDILIESGKITAEQRDAVLAEQGRLGPAAASPLTETEEATPGSAAKADKATVDEPAGRPETKEPPVGKGDFEVIVSQDLLTATLQPFGRKPATNTLEHIHRLLQARNITTGILSDSDIETYLKTDAPKGHSLIVARGTPPTPGTNAVLKYHFEAGKTAGKMIAGGKIDYRDHGEVPRVKKGDLLIEKTPITPGAPGINVHGASIPAPKPVDVKLRQGSGTKLSEDGLKLIALTNGQPKMTFGGRLCVLTELRIDGDVDLKTGHVDFDGNIVVTGCVQAGFRVHAHHLTAKEIMGAEIKATGNIKVTGGIIGAVINSQGNIEAKYIKSAQIASFGDISVLKEITDSTIETSGACRVANGKILASTISAKQGIFAQDIGTDVSTPCRLSAGVDAHIEQEIQGIQNAIARRQERHAQLRSKMAALDIEEQTLHQKITQLAQVQDRSMVARRDMQANLEKLKAAAQPEAVVEMEKKIQELAQKAKEAEETLTAQFDQQEKTEAQIAALETDMATLQEEIDELTTEKQSIRELSKTTKAIAVVSASGLIHVGTLITGLHTQLRLKETCHHARIQEVRTTDPDAANEWVMRLTPFK